MTEQNPTAFSRLVNAITQQIEQARGQVRQAVNTAMVQSYWEIGRLIVEHEQQGNRDNFLAKADPWIIAKAKAIGTSVVTHEAVAAVNTRKVKVPNICQQFEVPCLNTFQFLRELEARFVLGQ